MALEVQQFERWWPEVSRRLARSLARRGVPSDEAQDVVQDTALRALAAAPPVASQEELARWSFTVARRIEIDRARRRGRAEAAAEELARARPVAADVARAAEGRVALSTAARGLATLSATDRAALLSVLDDADAPPVADRRAAVRQAVRRHRARARLVAAVGKLVGVGVAAAQGVRRLADRLRSSRAGLALTAASALLLLPPSTDPLPSAASPSSPAVPAPVAPAADGPVAPSPVATNPVPAPVRRAATAPEAVPSSPASHPLPQAPPGQDPGDTRTTLPVGPDYSLLPVLMGEDAEVDPNHAVYCALEQPDVACLRQTATARL